ncbi:MAG: phosphatidate cytidylyltransferase [Bacteroidales bacterium]|nr:phosphatidate cytidylyltransferase [Bacteroidales bacterium]
MGSGKIKNLIVRTISGAVYAALMILSCIYPVLMIPLMCLISIIGIVEYFRMMDPEKSDRSSLFVLIAFALLIYLLLLVSKFSPMLAIGPYQQFHYLFYLFIILAVISLFRKQGETVHNIGRSLFAACWIVLPLSLMTNACLHDGQGGVVLLTFALIWINDSFAYLGGSMYGRHKMIERISPNKTWEGTLTGFIGTMGVSVLAGYFWADKILAGATFHWYGWMVFGFAVSLLATFGDLLESLLKRQAGVKDSGNIMPGHGGALDRMDSILFAIYPVITVLEVLLIL